MMGVGVHVRVVRCEYVSGCGSEEVHVVHVVNIMTPMRKSPALLMFPYVIKFQ